MNSLFEVSVNAITKLSPESAVNLMRAFFRSECRYAKLSPSVLTLSSQLMTADGGIDAQIDVPSEAKIPTDCIFQSGLTGFQIKSGAGFKPWTPSAIHSELLNKQGKLNSEVEHLVSLGGRYVLICTGYDLTPKQRNDSRHHIALILNSVGFSGYEALIDVLGASQIAEFAERYPGTASLLVPNPVEEAWTLEEWRLDAHISNDFEDSKEQLEVINQIRTELQGDTKHIRVLGEAGLGKTRLVLEVVKEENIAPYVLYIQNGSQFGKTKLFRQILKLGYDKPLVLVIDELAEAELLDIWRHLKRRCGALKIVSMDHGADETYDLDISRIIAPRLSDETIKKILANRFGQSNHLDRWVTICEGSPRVALAVADNLLANPDDLLKSPATVPLWSRFLHGYSRREESIARQIDCVTQHLALFSRFGYESPVGDEAKYIATLIEKIDTTMGWARFQEIVKDLRARRVLQGSKTLFFVPKALHIYLWRKFWESYGRGFDFEKTLQNMPESLHSWFMKMFKYAGHATTDPVISDILKPDGFFSERKNLISARGSGFLSLLAEANPGSVLRLLEATVGQWTDQELLDFKDNRQHLVWTLEKIAVWSTYIVRAIRLLSRLAINENCDNSNNATGILIDIFRIGPEWAVTESTPEERLPAMLGLLRSPNDKERLLGLKAMSVALDIHCMAFRIVGPEYQGLKERAKLWQPTTYGEWYQAKLVYFEALVTETHTWPLSLRSEVCQTLLEAVRHLIEIPSCTELAFRILEDLLKDKAMMPGKLNNFFWHWLEYEDNGDFPEITRRMKNLERQYTRLDLASRFQRYVIDVDWLEWDEDIRERRKKPKNRAKILVNLLARRIGNRLGKFSQIQHLIAPDKNAPALWYFGEKLAKNDQNRSLLDTLIYITLEKRHKVCLHGYLLVIKASDPDSYHSIVMGLLSVANTAWLGASITLSSDYNDALFLACLDALDNNWIDPSQFSILCCGSLVKAVPVERLNRLFSQLNEDDSQQVLFLLLDLLHSIPSGVFSQIDSNFIFKTVCRAIPGEEYQAQMQGYYWNDVCLKLVGQDSDFTLLLLNELLTKMGGIYRLSYDSYVVPLANELVQKDPIGAWKSIRKLLEEFLPKWNISVLHWLRGNVFSFGERNKRGAINDLPILEILAWIEADPDGRAALIAHAAPATLDDMDGGALTRELLCRYGKYEGVRNGISATFNSGGWCGLTSVYLKGKREQLRRWLSAGFEVPIVQWLEAEIEYLDRRIEQEEINEERSQFD